MNNNWIEIGQRVQAIRKAAKLNQSEFAIKAGINSQATISAIEQGDRLPTTEQLIAISCNLGVAVDWILTGRREEQPQAIVSEPMTGYSPDSKIIADMYEMKVEGKTAQERMDYCQKITETIRKG